MHLPIALLVTSVVACGLEAQETGTGDLQGALAGSWVGVLEYRDYSEPATSTKRVKLPTWLGIEVAGGDLQFGYVYDDGPEKTVTKKSLLRIDAKSSRCVTLDQNGRVEDSYAIDGLSELRQGRGTLTLTGDGTENNTPVSVRTTLRVGRNILEITRQTASTGQPFAFRHAYTFVRALPPGR